MANLGDSAKIVFNLPDNSTLIFSNAETHGFVRLDRPSVPRFHLALECRPGMAQRACKSLVLLRDYIEMPTFELFRV